MTSRKTKGNSNDAAAYRMVDKTEALSSDTPGSVPLAPDSQYSWIILLASFLTNVIVDGVCFAFGIFYPELLEYFNESRAKTALIGSVLNGTYMIMGKR